MQLLIYLTELNISLSVGNPNNLNSTKFLKNNRIYYKLSFVLVNIKIP